MRLTKKISRSGAVTLPKTLRTEMGLPTGSAVDIETCGKQIVIKKHTPLCYFCGMAENIFVFNGTEICTQCAEGIIREAGKK